SRSSSAASAPASWRIPAGTSRFSLPTTPSLPSFPGPLLSTSLRSNPAVTAAALALVLLGTAIGLVFFFTPQDADQGISQKIFSIHVPLALPAYACFGWGAWKALLHLWKRPPQADLESYVAIHQGVIFGALTLVTGSIWARASWGHWW